MLMRLLGRLRFLRKLGIGRIPDWLVWNRERLRSPGRITADQIPKIERPFRLDVKKGASFHVGRNVIFSAGFRARVGRGGRIEIGNDVLFNIFCWLGAEQHIKVGNGVLMAPRCTVVDAIHNFDDTDTPIWQQGASAQPVCIGNDVWIATGAVILKDVGDSTVIGANAVVTKPVPAGMIAVGVPAKVLKARPGFEAGAVAATPPVSVRPAGS